MTSTDKTRIEKYFDDAVNAKTLISFVTAGDPSPAHTVPAMHGLVAGGVDILEVGIPFSDPEAEGPAIQASSERALAQGMTLVKVLEMIQEFRRENTHTPVVLMGYLNSVLAMPNFSARAEKAGVDGLIMVNLPPEAGTTLQHELAAHNINLIYLIAPTTSDERAEYILSQSSGFVYYVSLKGITGASHLDTSAVAQKVAGLQRHTKLPICVGFGIKNAELAREVAKIADGVVVGSALVNLLSSYIDDVDAGSAAMQAEAKLLRQGVDEHG